jgi:putative membrane protein|tara:strand:- start:453 stop:833 length:381 start_codon:yes stop_codon:yes gene_type:complete
MAGLLYLPRIFVYHSENIKTKEICTVFKTMERKLFNYIMTPAMILSWLFGLILISIIGFESFGLKWLQIKLILVIFLTLYHFYLGVILANFKNDIDKKTSKFYRWLNEVPTIILIFVVFIVIFKPI